jgi:sodium transport system permease protein
MTRHAFIVYKKELKDMLRDRRMLVAAFSFALLGPVFMGVIFMLTRDGEAEAQNARLALANMDQAPGLVAFLEKQEINVTPFSGSAAPDSLPKGVDALLMLPGDYANSLAAGRIIVGQMYVDESSKTGLSKGREIKGALTAFSGYIAGIRLTARGVPPAIVSPLVVTKFDVSEESFFAQTATGSFLMLLIIAPFIGGLSVAVDTLAGERERHSMQPLLAQPVSPQDVIFGKLMMVSSFSIAGTLLALLTFLFAISLVPAGTLPLALHINAFTVSLVIIQLIPFAILIAATQLFISIQVKSFKEGQSYISMFMMVPMFMAYVKIFGASKLPEGAFFLPILSEMESLSSLIFNGKADLAHMGSSLVIAFVGAYILTKLTARKLESEVMLDAA